MLRIRKSYCIQEFFFVRKNDCGEVKSILMISFGWWDTHIMMWCVADCSYARLGKSPQKRNENSTNFWGQVAARNNCATNLKLLNTITISLKFTLLGIIDCVGVVLRAFAFITRCFSLWNSAVCFFFLCFVGCKWGGWWPHQLWLLQSVQHDVGPCACSPQYGNFSR